MSVEWGEAQCRHWLSEERTPMALAVAVWRALAIRQSAPGQQPLTADEAVAAAIWQALPKALVSPSTHLRAAVCRWLAQWDESQLLPLLQDPEPQLRAEAAIGLMQALHRNAKATNPSIRLTAAQREDLQSQAASALWLVTHEMSQHLTMLSGLPRTQAQHRLMRCLCHLGLAAPMGHAGITKLIDLLPPRLGLWFVLHHSDGHYLPWVVQRMNDPEVSRLAGWVWSAITGIDLHANNLALPPRAPEQAPRPTDTQDPGLLEPDAARIQALSLSLPAQVPTLYGQALKPEHLRTLLHHAPQALRWIAAQRLAQTDPVQPSTRAHARLQQAQ